MKVERIAAFSNGNTGGNPAGVVIADMHPEPEEMQRIAAEVGYSETVFAAPEGDCWRVRYFTPDVEVGFCGHATIALGAMLAVQGGNGARDLLINNGQISVAGHVENGAMRAVLKSPPAATRPAPDALVVGTLDLFGYTMDDLDNRLPPRIASAGNNHLVLALASRQALSRMTYLFEAGRDLMNAAELTTISIVVAEGLQRFHARNACASVGLYEDPATGSAAAALAGYLAEVGWPLSGKVEILQGEDMGVPSRIEAELIGAGKGVRVSGQARFIDV